MGMEEEMSLEDYLKITKNLNVLFIDIDEMSQESIATVLKNTFFPKLDTSLDANEALELFKSKKYDLVITDLNLSTIDGKELIDKFKSINPELFVIVVSAINEHEDVIDTMTHGIDGYILKPFVFDEFIKILEEIIRKVNVKGKLSLYEKCLEELVEERTSEIENNLYMDKLTGLGTLSSLLNTLEELDNFKSPIVILINIDRFSEYNQVYGLNIGNEILKQTSEFLKTYNRDKEYKLYRINADEFVLVDVQDYLHITKYEQHLEELFEKIENQTFTIDSVEEPLEIDITVGISFSSSDTLKKANMALYEARKLGKNFIGFSYDIDHTNELESNIYWRQEIKHAINENRVVAFYQPIVNREQEIVQYESLIRIRKETDNKEVEYYAPNEFLDLSMITKQYLSLTKFMIESTLKKIAEENLCISLNLTYQDIKNNEIYSILKTNINKYNLGDKTEFEFSNNVIFEILEQEGLDCYQTFVEFINEFKAMGVKIALDDFGTGFSNFSHINSLAPDYIKIDGDLITTINTCDKSYELIKAIVSFSKELEIKTIAEHVQSKEIFEVLHELGVDKFQGYYFGKPSLTTC